MRYRRMWSFLVAWLVLAGCMALPRWAGANGWDEGAQVLSNQGTAAFLLAGTALPLVTDGEEGARHSLRTADALAASMVITQALKMTVHETRPDGTTEDSFPSGHTTAAFAIATAQSHFHPKQAPYWYLGATLIAGSRVQLDRHFPQDVLAGAAIGYFTTRWALSHERGVLLTPIIGSNRSSSGVMAVVEF